MSLTDDQILQAIRGYDPQTDERGKIMFKDICYIYPVILDEIRTIGYSTVTRYLGMIIGGKPIITDEDTGKGFKELFDNMSDFQFLVMRGTTSAEEADILKRAFHFFLHEEVIFLPNFGIIVGPLDEQRVIKQEDFEEFVATLRSAQYADPGADDIVLRDDDTPHVRKLKLQQIENRKRIAKAKEKQGKGSGIQLSDLIASLAAKGENGLSLLNIWYLSYYGFQDQLRRLNLIEEYDMKTRAALAGAKINKKELKHWMQHLSPQDKK